MGVGTGLEAGLATGVETALGAGVGAGLETGWALGLAAAAVLAGAGVGWWGWTWAAREERTAVPGSWRPWLAGLTAVAWGSGALLSGSAWLLPAVLMLATGAVVLGAVDLRHRLLPNRMVGALGAAAAVTLAVAALGLGQPLRLLWMLAGAAGLFLLYLLLTLASPGSLGMGDVKLAGVLGAYGGWLGFSAWWGVLLSGFLIGGVWAVVVLVVRRGGLRQRFAYGPAMLLGALLVVFALV